MRLALATLLATLAPSTLALAGCNLGIGEDSAGETGKLRFEYSSSDCVVGCGLDKPALQGSRVTVMARDTASAGGAKARLTAETVAKIAMQTEMCSCDKDSGASRSVSGGEACASDEKRRCTLQTEIETTGAGETKLEIVDYAGTVVDRIGVSIRPAAKIDLHVRANGAVLAKTGDVYEVKLGDKIAIESDVFDASGAKMIFTEHGLHHAYGDETVLRQDKKVLFGDTDVENVATGKSGETTVTVSAPGASTTVRFRVK